MKLQIKVDDEGNIVDSCFKTFGCGSAIASSSVATEWVKGKSLDDVLTIKNSDIAKHLSLPPVKLHCSMLAGTEAQTLQHGGGGRGGGGLLPEHLRLQWLERQCAVAAGMINKH